MKHNKTQLTITAPCICFLIILYQQMDSTQCQHTVLRQILTILDTLCQRQSTACQQVGIRRANKDRRKQSAPRIWLLPYHVFIQRIHTTALSHQSNPCSNDPDTRYYKSLVMYER